MWVSRSCRIRITGALLAAAWPLSATGDIVIEPWVPLFRGVDHAVGYADASDGRPQLVNCVRVDMADSQIQFVATPSNGPAPLETVSHTGSQFLVATGAQVGVNTSFYVPCCSTQPENKDLIGLAVSDGVLVSPAQSDARAALLIDVLNQAWFVNTVTDSYSLQDVLFAFTGSNFVLGVGRDRSSPRFAGNSGTG